MLSIDQKINIKNFVWPWLFSFLLCSLAIFLFILSIFIEVPLKISGKGWFLMHGEIHQITSLHHGIIDEWLVKEGDNVEISQIVAKIISEEDPTKFIEIRSLHKGIMAEILAFSGSKVVFGQSLALITPHGDKHQDLQIMAFVSSLDGKKIRPGMAVEVFPSITDFHQNGYLVAQVSEVSKLPIAKSALYSLIKIPELAKYIRQSVQAEPFVISLKPVLNSNHKTGYLWQGKGPLFALDSGIIADVYVIYEYSSILKLIWPSFHNLLFRDE